MENVIVSLREAYANTVCCSVDQVPTYVIRTPLQKAVQLLKRHRDVYFMDNDADSPISIIITTLAAHAYSGEIDLYDALQHIRKMPQYIEKRDNKYWIPNPTMTDENFADKWNESPSKAEAFQKWINQAQIGQNRSACYRSQTHWRRVERR